MKFKSLQRGIFESIILLFVFITIFAFMIHGYFLEQTRYREKALHYELVLLRQAISTFDIIEKRKPISLVELALMTFQLPGDKIGKRYIDRIIINDRGEIIDPFGNPYIYNEENGWVSSSSEDYKQW
ncbi:MAG: hypothetical protein ABH871_00630 [Pseudomonadota bacterium]